MSTSIGNVDSHRNIASTNSHNSQQLKQSNCEEQKLDKVRLQSIEKAT